MDYKKLADVLVDYSINPVPGDTVCVIYEPQGAEAALEVGKRLTVAGCHVFFDTAPEGWPVAFLQLASDKQLKRTNPFARWYRTNADAMIAIRAPKDLRCFDGIDPKVLSLRGASAKPLTATTNRRTTNGSFKWVLTELPTETLADQVGWSLEQLDRFITCAGMLHLDDPADFWRRFGAWQQGVVDSLDSGRKQVHLLGSSIDLHLSIAGRKWDNCCGHINFPDGEVFTGPVEDSVYGWYRPITPTFYKGSSVDGIYLEFEQGRVVKASASRNEEFLLATLDTDEGSRYLGEFGIGTHYGMWDTDPIGSILFDEKKAGTVHFALGNGYDQTGSKNRSGVHWDMLIPMKDGTITMDGEIVYQNGHFLIGDPSVRPSMD